MFEISQPPDVTIPRDGTVVIYGPVYARSGFGLLARGWVFALHHAGVRVRVAPVDCPDPKVGGDLDDCDLYLLRKLENTEIRGPLTAIFAYVPIYAWPKMALPEPNVRIMLTTFDSSAQAKSPPYRLVHICNQMDQVWLANRSEEQAWIRGGLKPELIRTFRWPNDWIDNPILGPVRPKPVEAGGVFRFLHVSVFFPRRRLDVLIAAFFEEFAVADSAELYLKITYPDWHPVAEKPKRDLNELIERFRRQTGSKARVIVDETMGTRKELARLFDSCDFYVSPDTSSTAPVSEALFRGRLGIITDGWNVELPPEMIVVKNSARRVQVTPEMGDYMPHHRGSSFPALEVADMRAALRQAHSISPERRTEKAASALEFMRERFSYASTVPSCLTAMREAWQRRNSAPVISIAPSSKPVKSSPPGAVTKPKTINWCGLQLFYGKIAALNRGLCLELLRGGHQLTLRPSNGPFQIEEMALDDRPEYLRLAERFYAPMKNKAEITVSARWHPIFEEEAAAKQVMISTWWSGAIPAEWVRRIRDYADEVWVPGRHVRDNFLEGGVPAGKLWVMPVGVEVGLFRPEAEPLPLKTRKNFKFLFVGETTQRKGLDTLLNAYAKSFSRKDDVCLVIKDINSEVYYGRNAAAKLIRECQANPQMPEIEYLDSMLSEVKMPSLYAACDCFVQPFRVASFPLAVLEAMACGLPVITTDYAGAQEFCDDRVSYLLPAREIHRETDFVGHWRVTGRQRHAEVEMGALQERMRHVAAHLIEAKAIGKAAREKICAEFAWEKQGRLVGERLDELSGRENGGKAAGGVCAPAREAAPPTQLGDALRWLGLKEWAGSVLFFAPFFNRSGYGTGARAVVAGLRAAGVRVRIVPLDNVEPGIDDCDMAALKALEQTPLTLPVAAVFFHVPHANWLKVPLPEKSIRIMYTTFDSSAQGNKPPADWLEVCRQMDQVWLMTKNEAAVFQAAGIDAQKVKMVPCPHGWINNPSLPTPLSVTEQPVGKFRFLSMAMFLPRRRWDTLIEAFLAEFREEQTAELYLKVNYPSWHPVPGGPQRELRQLIESLRQKTGSKAQIVIDEELGTRLDICRIIDSCQVYVSTDTSSTAPLSEALVRGRMAVIPGGYGANLPHCESILIIPVDPEFKTVMTPEMVLYQPHHRGREMPLLKVADVRCVLRRAFDLRVERRAEMGRYAALFMESDFGISYTTPLLMRALQSGFQKKFKDLKIFAAPPEKPGSPADHAAAPIAVHWEGSFLDYGSLSHVNRELTRQLAGRCETRLTRAGIQAAAQSPVVPAEFQELACQLRTEPPRDVQVTVRQAWPPNWAPVRQGALVVIQPWEYGSLPAEWVAQARNVQQFWVPSEHVRQVYVQSGVPEAKVKIVPNGIDPERFRPGQPPLALATRKTFKFLFVGGTIHRKGPDVLLQAYLRAFTAQDDVCLIIKDFGGATCYAGQTMERTIRAAQCQPNAPELIHLTEELPPECLPGLYAACDCLVHPYRGEGFGLPVLEAMACGLPVIVTAGGATDDFATADLVFRISAERRTLGREISGRELAGEGWMLEPSAVETAAQMLRVFARREEARAKGREASESARRDWTWQRAAEIALGHLRSLAAEAKSPRPRLTAPSRGKSTPIQLPPCALVGRLTGAHDSLRKKQYRAAWEAGLAAIKERPCHPEAFVLLSEIAAAVGDSVTARHCAQHARALAPEWKPAKQALKANPRGNTKPEWLTLPQSLLDSQSKAAPRLSVCLIAKNEEKFIGRCLASVRDVAAQIVLVDTGSSDRTVAIAREFNAEVHSFAWTDDFSAARNEALKRATGDWVLFIDADEELIPEHKSTLAREIQVASVMAYRLPIIDVGKENEGCSYVPRLFRNAPGLFFVGRVHEQVFTSIEVRRQEWGLANRLGKTALLHHGYTAAVMADRNKIERNLALLERAIEEMPNEPNLLMSYGLELVRSGRLDAGLERYWDAFHLMAELPVTQVTPEMRETLLTQLTTQLMAKKDFAGIVKLWQLPFAKSTGMTASQHFMLGLAHLEFKEASEAAEQLRQCLAKRNQPALSPINKEILGPGPHHCLALCLAALKQYPDAEQAFQAALAATPKPLAAGCDFARFKVRQGQPIEALKVLNGLVAENAGETAAWELGGQIALSQVEFREFARDWTGEAFKHFPEHSAITLQRAEALLLNQEVESALPLWKKAHQPQSARHLAALVLCEFLMEDVHRRFAPADELAVSQEFLKWYRQLTKAGAHSLVNELNEKREELRGVLPSFVSACDAAVNQAELVATV